MIIHSLLIGALALLSIWIVAEDLRRLEIAALPVLALAVLAGLCGVLFPLPGLTPDQALWGAALGLTMGTLTRGYVHWRVGVPAFGGADIALMAGAGGLLGPFLFGPWLLSAAVFGGALLFLSPLILRKTHLDGEDLEVLPFCPALIISTIVVYAIALAGWIPTVLAG